MLPRRQDDVIERAKAEIIMPPEMAEAGAIPMLPHQLDPRLRWDDYLFSKNQLDHHPLSSPPLQLPHPPHLPQPPLPPISLNPLPPPQPPSFLPPHLSPSPLHLLSFLLFPFPSPSYLSSFFP